MNLVQPGSFLTLHYRLAGPDGADIVNTFADKPATLSLGTGELAAPLEQRLIGDLGFDSLMLVELATAAGEAFPGLRGLPRSLFSSETTPGSLARHIDGALSERTAAPKAAAESPAAPHPVSRYLPLASAAPLPAAWPGSVPSFAAEGLIAIVGEGQGLAPILLRRLSAAGAVVQSFSGHAADAAKLAALAPRSLRALIDLRQLDDAEGELEISADFLTPVMRALALIQATLGSAAPAGYVVVHRGLAGAGLAGFAKALAREWPEALVKSIAVSQPADLEALGADLYAELCGRDATVEVQLSGAERLTWQIVPVSAAPAAPLAEGVVAVISGGAHGLGRALALELARRYHGRLVLLGRRPIDDQIAALIGELRATGGDAIYCVADVRDAAAVGVVLATGFALFVSVRRKAAGVAGQREVVERRSARVAAMTGIDRDEQRFDKEAAEFPPALDLIAPAIGIVGLVAAGIDAGSPAALSVARILVGAAFLGAITDAMLLGHWYLVQPGLARGPLLELVRWTQWIWPFEVLVMLIPASEGMLAVLNGTIDDDYGGILGWMWVTCAVTTLGLLLVTRAALKERQYSAVMAATGLLYLAILTAFGTDLVARAVLS